MNRYYQLNLRKISKIVLSLILINFALVSFTGDQRSSKGCEALKSSNVFIDEEIKNSTLIYNTTNNNFYHKNEDREKLTVEEVLCLYDGIDMKMRIENVKSWVYNINDSGTERQRKQLTENLVDMYVIDPLVTESWNTDFDIEGLIDEIKQVNIDKRGVEPLVLAYINIGQAEDWRWYWQKGWKPGTPSWIVSRDPAGWPGCYPVLFWDEQWQAIVKQTLGKILAAGFDGIYMDWVEIYLEENVLNKARKLEIKETHELLFDYFEKLRVYAREESTNNNRDFLMIAQNAAFLFEKNPKRYKKLIDAIALEGIWYTGTGGMESWDDPKGFNVLTNSIWPGSTEAVLKYLEEISKYMPVFNVEYAQDVNGKDYGTRAIRKSQERNFIVTVARRDLSRISTMPPPPISR